ncbi:MAG: magnesium/cobalt transporter CorA [Gammaproteobacteria bacterium]|nr:magnesium/cobalt transporter CorA [Gammaproteobacteria bacterium]MDH5592776.1 magnesium/cobalt transporter CorA [Gammaproteobacteria bacterium]
MTDTISQISRKTGMSPGSLVYVGEMTGEGTHISVIDYDKQKIEERAVHSVEEILPYRERDTITWVNVSGLENTGLIESFGQAFNIHPLVLEDILNTHQRPKFEEYDDYLFIVLKSLSQNKGGASVAAEQICILLLNNFVFTFKEQKDDLFQPVRSRIDNSKGRIRNLGADYLVYTLVDTIVDRNFVILESISDVIEQVEDELLDNPEKETLATIQQTKRSLISIRRMVSPLRDLISSLLRSDSRLIDEKTHIYFRDVQDHVLRITETLESYRDMLSGLLDIYISSVSNKMNEVMKVLTVFASIFIPLTFIAGIYGMNFEYMPELKWKWAYPVLLGLFLVIPVVLLIYFKKKKWL